MFESLKQKSIHKIASFLEKHGRRIVVPVKIPVLQNQLLVGRQAFITGGSKGIGRAIAAAYLAAGCKVIISGRDEVVLRSSAASLSKLGRAVDWVCLDNCNPKEFPSAVRGLFDKHGAIDILVNNAGVTGGGDFGGVTVDSWDKVLNSILRGSYLLSQEFAKVWRDRKITKANILNICSTSSLRPGHSPYCICKSAEKSMTEGLAKYLLPAGVVVNGIGPGVTCVERFLADSNQGIQHPRNPAGRYVTEEEIANFAVILVSDMSRMVVGDILYVGGGAGIVTFEDEGEPFRPAIVM